MFCMRSHCISLILSYKSKTVFSDFPPSPCIENRINFEKLPQLLQSFHHTGMKICASDFLQNQSCWFTTSMVNVFSVHSLCVSLTFMSTLENSGEVAVYLMLQCAPFPFECNCVRYCWIGSSHLNTMSNMFNTHSMIAWCGFWFLVSACSLARFVFTHIHIGLSFNTYKMYMKCTMLVKLFECTRIAFSGEQTRNIQHKRRHTPNSLGRAQKISHTTVSYERGFLILMGHKRCLDNTVVILSA